MPEPTSDTRLAFSRRRALASAASLAVLAATACIGPPNPVTAQAPRPYQLYLSDILPAIRLLSLDAQTLGDLPATLAVAVTAPWATFSADGSTLVELNPASTATASTIIVRRGPTLVERARFQPPALVMADFRLSNDGRTLVIPRAQQTAGTDPLPATWYVLDTTSGRLRATVPATEASVWYPWWIDPAATRLYQPVVTLTTADTTPKPLQLVAYDLATGREAGRLTLPEVLAGTWRPGGAINGDPIVQEQYPALTLNAIGDTLVIYQPDPPHLTLIDAARLVVKTSGIALAASGVLAALAAAVPFLPQIASAKEVEGTNLQAVAAPDGRSLYVWGDVDRIAADGIPTYGHFGLQRIDLQRGTVVAQALPDAQLLAVVPAPDGRSVYTFGPTTTMIGPDFPALLRRLDAETLATTATRECTGFHQLLVRSL